MTAAPRKTLHGRRKGRPLRPNQQTLVTDLLPRLAFSLKEKEPLDPQALFDRPHPELWLEIGFGGGEHLAWQIERHAQDATEERGPGPGFLGAEVFINGIARLLGRLEESQSLAHLRLFQGDARMLLEALPEGCLDRVFILFPDPWPKARHNKRRLIRRETLAQLARCMKAGSELRIATDDADYLAWILERLTEHRHFQLRERGRDDWLGRPEDWPPTRYEQKALAAGRHPTFLRLRRKPETAA